MEALFLRFGGSYYLTGTSLTQTHATNHRKTERERERELQNNMKMPEANTNEEINNGGRRRNPEKLGLNFTSLTQKIFRGWGKMWILKTNPDKEHLQLFQNSFLLVYSTISRTFRVKILPSFLCTNYKISGHTIISHYLITDIPLEPNMDMNIKYWL